jgi:hypothetical protein
MAKPQGVPSAIPAEVAAVLVFITCIQIFIASINKHILTITATLLDNL